MACGLEYLKFFCLAYTPGRRSTSATIVPLTSKQRHGTLLHRPIERFLAEDSVYAHSHSHPQPAWEQITEPGLQTEKIHCKSLEVIQGGLHEHSMLHTTVQVHDLPSSYLVKLGNRLCPYKQCIQQQKGQKYIATRKTVSVRVRAPVHIHDSYFIGVSKNP